MPPVVLHATRGDAARLRRMRTSTLSEMHRWRWLLGLLLLITALAVTPAPPRQADLGWDKLSHVLAFAALGWCAICGWRGARPAVLLALLAFGGAIELLQLQVPNRSGEWGDLAADAVGLGLGALLALLWLRRR